jgi:hypothetical protein
MNGIGFMKQAMLRCKISTLKEKKLFFFYIGSSKRSRMAVRTARSISCREMIKAASHSVSTENLAVVVVKP